MSETVKTKEEQIQLAKELAELQKRQLEAMREAREFVQRRIYGTSKPQPKK